MEYPTRPPTHKGMLSAKKIQNDKFQLDMVHASSNNDLPEDEDEEMMDVDTNTRNLFQNTKHQAQGHGPPPISTPTPRHFFPPGSASKPKTRKVNKSTTKGTATDTDMLGLLAAFSPRENHRLSRKFPGLQNHRGRGLSAREISMRRRAGGKPKDIIAHPKKRGVAIPRYLSLRGKLGFRGQLARPKRVGSEGVSAASSRLRDRLAKRRRLKQEKMVENEVMVMFQGMGFEDGEEERKIYEE